MSTFNRTILVRGIGTSGADNILVLLEELANFRVVVKFTTLVKEDILVLAFRGVGGEECIQPINGRSFGDAGITMHHPGEMVSNKNPTSFTIETNKVSLSSGIFGLGSREGKVDGETLVRLSGRAGPVE